MKYPKILALFLIAVFVVFNLSGCAGYSVKKVPNEAKILISPIH